MNQTFPTIPTEKLNGQHVPSLSLFAQLLASERLTVTVDSNLKTAQFSPERRILALPSWSGFDEASWLLFIAHEVGHALYTPADALTTHPTWQRLIKTYPTAHVLTVANVFEDIRIERLVRVQYRGLSGVFNRGYHALLGRQFFGFDASALDAATWQSKTILDRINLYAKVGAFLRQPLVDGQEIAWYNRGQAAQTYDDVLVIVEDVLQKLPKEQLRQQQKQQGQQQQKQQQGQQGQPQESQESQESQQGQQGQSQDGQSQESQESKDGQSQESQESKDGQSQDSQSQDSQSQDSQSQDSQSQDGQSKDGQSQSQDGQSKDGQSQSQDGQPSQSSSASVDPFAVDSQKAAADALSQAAQYGYSEQVVTLPTNTTLLHENDATLTEMLEQWTVPAEMREALIQILTTQRREQSSILASMIATFRANQAAWQARRVQVARSGSLDTNKLAQYKLTEDLFLRRRSLPEAQNHGFVLHIDWSGSMDTKMSTVLWQVLHLVWFAESIKVPIAVYGFSNAGETTPSAQAAQTARRDAAIANGSYDYQYGNRVRLLELYRSDVPASVKVNAQAFLLALALRFATSNNVLREHAYESSYGLDRLPRSLVPALTTLRSRFTTVDTIQLRALNTTFAHPYVALGGTPLLKALFTSVDTVRAFRQRSRVEQCVSIWLTDGDDTDGFAVESANGRPYRVTPSKVVDLRSGRTFEVAERRGLAAGFDIHRTLTGATVVCIDITSVPGASLGRVLSRPNLAVVANQLGQQEQVYSRRRWRRRSGYVKPKVLVQTRKRVILPTSTGTFDETGLLLVTRREYPEIGADAYLVSHPAWWMTADAGTKASVTAANQVLSRSSNLLDEHDEDDEDDDDEDVLDPSYRSVDISTRVLAQLKEQHASVVMRRFADLLVPYLAAGRDDASVR